MLQVPAQSQEQGGRTDQPARGTAMLNGYMGKSRQWCKSGKHRTGLLMHMQQPNSYFPFFLNFPQSEFFVNKNTEVFGVTRNKDNLFALPAGR